MGVWGYYVCVLERNNRKKPPQFKVFEFFVFFFFSFPPTTCSRLIVSGFSPRRGSL